jgi:hypothetical protein
MSENLAEGKVVVITVKALISVGARDSEIPTPKVGHVYAHIQTCMRILHIYG